jgi:hypothetical protein
MMASAQSLNRAFVMTQQMLALAKSGDWEQVIGLEADRQKIIMDNVTGEKSIDRASEIGRMIQNILKLDAEIQSLAVQARDETRDELITLNRSKSKVQAYQQP